MLTATGSFGEDFYCKCKEQSFGKGSHMSGCKQKMNLVGMSRVQPVSAAAGLGGLFTAQQLRWSVFPSNVLCASPLKSHGHSIFSFGASSLASSWVCYEKTWLLSSLVFALGPLFFSFFLCFIGLSGILIQCYLKKKKQSPVSCSSLA